MSFKDRISRGIFYSRLAWKIYFPFELAR